MLAEFSQAETTANEAAETIAQADAFAAEQGDSLDPEAKAEIEALKLEAAEAQQKFEELKARLDSLNSEISAFEETGETGEAAIESEESAEPAEVEESGENVAGPVADSEQPPQENPEKVGGEAPIEDMDAIHGEALRDDLAFEKGKDREEAVAEIVSIAEELQTLADSEELQQIEKYAQEISGQQPKVSRLSTGEFYYSGPTGEEYQGLNKKVTDILDKLNGPLHKFGSASERGYLASGVVEKYFGTPKTLSEFTETLKDLASQE